MAGKKEAKSFRDGGFAPHCDETQMVRDDWSRVLDAERRMARNPRSDEARVDHLLEVHAHADRVERALARLRWQAWQPRCASKRDTLNKASRGANG